MTRRGLLTGLVTLAAMLPVGLPTTAAAVAPPSPTCIPRSASIPQGPAVLLHTATVPNQAGRVADLTFQSPALNAQTHVYVMLPAGYDPSGHTRYPVLYLLHGADGWYHDWVDHGVRTVIDQATAAGHLPPFITVMPDGGLFGYYVDWYGTDVDGHSPNPPPAWETYHVHELIPWIDAHYPTIKDRSGRAVAGLSMGGFGAMTYAAKHPDLFTTAGSFSGAVDSDYQYPYANTVLTAASPAFTQGAPDTCMFGDPLTQQFHWQAADPTYLAPNLAGLSLFQASGNGNAGPYDDPNNQPAEGAQSSVEQFVYPMNTAFDATLTANNIPHSTYFYGAGTHAWPYWLRDLQHYLPQMTAAFGTQPAVAPATAFSYRSGALAFSVWGWDFSTDRGTPEFLYLERVGRAGLEASGSGTVGVTTAALYAPGSAAVVAQGAVSHTITADAAGRLHFTIDLGPAHPVQQTDFSATANSSWVHAAVTIQALAHADAATGPGAEPTTASRSGLPPTSAAAPAALLAAFALLVLAIAAVVLGFRPGRRGAAR